MTQHTAVIVIVAVMAAGVMVTATTAAVAAVKALRDYMQERGKKNETWIDPQKPLKTNYQQQTRHFPDLTARMKDMQ